MPVSCWQSERCYSCQGKKILSMLLPALTPTDTDYMYPFVKKRM